jgi:hypothetical protein
LLREEYRWFKDWGELSDDDHVAYEVVAQALRGGEEVELAGNVPFHKRERPGEQWPPSVRAMLFDEALYAEPPLRKLARAAIAAEVAYGGDIENPAFGARHGIPAYGSVAMHVLDWQRRLALPPYEERATEIFVRQDNIRGRIDQSDPRWFDVHAEAVVKFWQTGELPDDELHLDALLVDVEVDLLRAHKGKKDVAEAMALLARIARAKGDEREGLLDELTAMAAGRRLVRDRGTAKAPNAPVS